MKIRQDFVTNSSSSCSIALTTENPVLLEILQRYKEQGAFGSAGTTFGVGEYTNVPFGFTGIGYFDPDLKTQSPAFSFSEGFENEDLFYALVAPDFPKNLEEVLSIIVKIMDYSEGYKHRVDGSTILDLCQYDKALFKELIRELNDRKDEIIKAFTQVYCKVYEDNSEEDCASRYLSFEYDPTNGARINVEEVDENEDDYDDEDDYDGEDGEDDDFTYEDDPHVDEFESNAKISNCLRDD